MRPLPLVTVVEEVMLLRGVGPHSHPQTESSGVVWGGVVKLLQKPRDSMCIELWACSGARLCWLTAGRRLG